MSVEFVPRRPLSWLRCLFRDHQFEDEGDRYLIGDTTAPYPAVDEYRQSYRCPRCGKTDARYAGFLFDGDRP